MAVLIIHLLWGKIQDNSLVNFQSPAIIKGFPKSRIQNQRIKNQHSAGFLRRSVQSPTTTHTIFQSPAVMQTLVLEICTWLNQKVPKIVSCAFFFGRLLDDIVLNPNVETAWERGRCAPQETECVSQKGGSEILLRVTNMEWKIPVIDEAVALRESWKSHSSVAASVGPS